MQFEWTIFLFQYCKLCNEWDAIVILGNVWDESPNETFLLHHCSKWQFLTHDNQYQAKSGVSCNISLFSALLHTPSSCFILFSKCIHNVLLPIPCLSKNTIRCHCTLQHVSFTSPLGPVANQDRDFLLAWGFSQCHWPAPPPFSPEYLSYGIRSIIFHFSINSDMDNEILSEKKTMRRE